MRLRRVLRLVKNKYEECTLPAGKLVIDGKSFFRGSYKKSGCQYTLGGEYDRYADFIRKKLQRFTKANITCYVVFKGAMIANKERRLELHQERVDNIIKMDPSNKDLHYCDPAFVKKVHKQVLDELGIKYAVKEYENASEMINAAKEFNCILVTDFVELCLFGVNCVSTDSIKFDEETNQIKAHLYNARTHIGLPRDKLGAFLVLLNQDNEFLNQLRNIITICNPHYSGPTVRNWMFKKSKHDIFCDLSKNLKREDFALFKQLYEDMMKKITSVDKDSLVLHHFKSNVNVKHLPYSDEMWFEKALSVGHIATEYVNLKRIGLFSGSWLICDEEQDDPMLAASEIVLYAQQILTDFSHKYVNFVGRVSNLSKLCGLNGKTLNWPNQEVQGLYFEHFLQLVMPGFEMSRLNNVPEDCRMLLISLMYYFLKKNRDFIKGVHSIILSYVMLGPVASKTGLLKRTNHNLTLREYSDEPENTPKDELSKNDCYRAGNAMLKYFYQDNLAEVFDRSVIHKFSEFKHCLGQLNDLNLMCGENTKRTIYHKTYNATFVNNIRHEMKRARDPMRVVEDLLVDSPSVLRLYTNIMQVFLDCVHHLKYRC